MVDVLIKTICLILIGALRCRPQLECSWSLTLRIASHIDRWAICIMFILIHILANLKCLLVYSIISAILANCFCSTCTGIFLPITILLIWWIHIFILSNMLISVQRIHRILLGVDYILLLLLGTWLQFQQLWAFISLDIDVSAFVSNVLHTQAWTLLSRVSIMHCKPEILQITVHVLIANSPEISFVGPLSSFNILIIYSLYPWNPLSYRSIMWSTSWHEARSDSL